jgi:hypothetical protein
MKWSFVGELLSYLRYLWSFVGGLLSYLRYLSLFSYSDVTNNVNKTWALLQTTGGKDEPNKHE